MMQNLNHQTRYKCQDTECKIEREIYVQSHGKSNESSDNMTTSILAKKLGHILHGSISKYFFF